MVKHITPTKALSRFVQLLDGGFPSGIFVHSFGLESHIVLGKVVTIDDLEIYLQNILIDQYQKFEFPFIARVYKHLADSNLKKLCIEDEKYTAMLNLEYAKASTIIGTNYLKHIHFDIQNPIVEAYLSKVKSKETSGNELAILSAYAYELGLSQEMLRLLWAKKSLISLSACTLKISRIKSTEIQKMLFRFDDYLEAHTKYIAKEVENFNPLFEEVMYQHLHLQPKLFMT